MFAPMPTRSLNCPLCGRSNGRILYEASGVPVQSVRLFRSAEEAKACPRGAIRLSGCPACTFITNTAFDEKQVAYLPGYEPTQSFSPVFNRFHRQLAERLVVSYGLKGKEVLEIGCGQGEFLELLCRAGMRRGVGFDPAFDATHPPRVDGSRVTIVPEPYTAGRIDGRPDLVCCKMTLEHIADPVHFVRDLRPALAHTARPVLFYQVPDVTRILEQCAFWDIYYEHCSYFTPRALRTLFEGEGYEILRVDSVYGGQYLALEARVAGADAPGPSRETQEPLQASDRFREGVMRTREEWKRRVRVAHRAGRRLVLWGSGSKAVSFLNTLRLGEEVLGVVDVNPNRQGTYMPGTAHAIVAPERLVAIRPDRVLLMNPVYEREVRHMLAERELGPEIWTLA